MGQQVKGVCSLSICKIGSQLSFYTMYVGQLSFPRRKANIEIRIRESVKVALGQPEVQCGDHEGKFIL